MITDPAANTILCFGDSNTYGIVFDGVDYGRLPTDTRWPGQLQAILGARGYVIEEGLNGRTTDLDYPDRPGCNGRAYLTPCLLSHNPIDAVVLMLGGNDLKVQFNRSPRAIAAAIDGLIGDIRTYAVNQRDQPPTVVVVGHVPIDPDQPFFTELNADNFDADSVRKSSQLNEELRQLADRRGLPFADAAAVARTGPDGTHLTPGSHREVAGLIASVICQQGIVIC